MEKQKKSYGKTALIVLLLIITIASLVLATYAWAKYTSTTEGNATAQVAKWDVGVNFTANQFEERYQHVLANRLAPGMAGSFIVTINPGKTEVDFDYEIILEEVKAEKPQDETGDDNSYQVPKHLHFYTTDTTNGSLNTQEERDKYEIEIGDSVHQETDVENYLTGTVTQGTQVPVTKTIYWEWPYEKPEGADGSESEWDQQDTTDGKNPAKVTVSFKVVATQKNPTPQE